MISSVLNLKIMIDKKQLIEELLECVQDATDTETKITGLTMCATLFESILDEAINYSPCCKSDSELLPTKKDFISELEQYQEKYKTAHTEKVNNAYVLGFRHCFHFINDRVKLK